MEEAQDEVTLLMSQVIIEPKDEKLQPRIEIVDPAHKAKDKHGKEIAGRPEEVLPAGRRPPRGQGRRQGPRRRDPGQDPARAGQDQGHHRRSAAGRGALRGPPAQDPGRHLRDRRRRRVRRPGPRLPQDHGQERPGRQQGIPDPPRRPHQRRRRRAGQGRHAAHGRPGQPARHPAGPGREGAGRVPAPRGPGGLPPAGRPDQRQAHRDDHPPDAALGQSRGGRRHRVPGRRAGRQVRLPGGEPQGRGEGRQAGQGPAAPAGHHQERPQHGQLPLGRLLPGDDPGADRGLHVRQDRLPAEPEGEHHHGPADPGRDGLQVLSRGGDPGRKRGGGRKAGRGRPPPELTTDSAVESIDRLGAILLICWALVPIRLSLIGVRTPRDWI